MRAGHVGGSMPLEACPGSLSTHAISSFFFCFVFEVPGTLTPEN